MIERTVTVKSAEFKDTKGGKRQYLSAVLVGDNGRENTQAILDPAIQKTIQEAYKSSALLLIRMEKEGQFWNIKSAEITTNATPQASKPSGSYNKDDDILMAVAFKGAIELETHLVPGAEPNTARVLQTTSELLAGLLMMRPRREEK